jgi:hypothetical protein
MEANQWERTVEGCSEDEDAVAVSTAAMKDVIGT